MTTLRRMGAAIVMALVFGSVVTPITTSGLVMAGATMNEPTCVPKVSWGPSVSAATQELLFTLRLTNSATRSCRFSGPPVIRFFDAKGRALPFTFVHRATGGYPMATDVPLVILKPHASAYVLVAKVTCQGADGAVATSMTVVAPQAPRKSLSRLTWGVTTYPRFHACVGADAHIFNRVAVSSVQPALSAIS